MSIGNNNNEAKILAMKNRIHILNSREPIPYNIINKLKRRLRNMEVQS